MVPVGDKRRAGEAPAGAVANVGGYLVADEADHPGCGQRPQVRELLRMDEALNRLVERDTGTDEDREDDEEPGKLLGTEAPQVEGDPERDRRRRVAEVVDQVGEQRDRTGQDEDRQLEQRGDYQDGEADRDRFDAGP